jgi:tRNA dimethylallyltransferase
MNTSSSKPLAVAIMGPTASGKTAAALAIARERPVEIISVDSALVYRDMDIGTAKPTPEELAAVPHHLIDIIDPLDAYSVAQFREATLRLVAEISARGKLPLLVGGTMMYFKGLTEGLDDLPTADAEVRAAIEAEAARIGWPGMHEKLRAVDPVTAERLKPNDAQRINRALEIYELSGKPMSELLTGRGKLELPFDLVSYALEPSDRSVLHARIALRFDQMLGERDVVGPSFDALRRVSAGVGISGWPNHARRVARNRYHRHSPACQAPDYLAACDAGADRDRLPRPGPVGSPTYADFGPGQVSWCKIFGSAGFASLDTTGMMLDNARRCR